MKVEAINSTAVRLEWKPPLAEEQNGIIRGYQIHYVNVNEGGEPIGLPIMFDYMDTTKTEMVLSQLQPATLYQFQVAGYNRRGDGERSRPKTATTKGAGQCLFATIWAERQLLLLELGKVEILW